MKLKPLADRVILKQFKAEEKTKSGLILAASAQEKPEMFEVVEVGPGGMVDGNEVKMTVAAGDRVIVGKYSGTTVKVDGEEYSIVRQGDILAVVEYSNRFDFRRLSLWQNRSFIVKKHAKRCSAAWISLQIPSRSPSAPRAATWCWTRSSAHR